MLEEEVVVVIILKSRAIHDVTTQGVHLMVALYGNVNALNEHHLLDPYGMNWISVKIRFTHIVFFVLIVCTMKL